MVYLNCLYFQSATLFLIESLNKCINVYFELYDRHRVRRPGATVSDDVRRNADHDHT